MQTQIATAQTAKQKWVAYLTAKVENWKADTDIYIKNSENLLMDDIMDIAKGKWKTTVLTKKGSDRISQLHLDNNDNLPETFMLRLDAIKEYASDLGIQLDYNWDFVDDNNLDKGIVITWEVISINSAFMPNIKNWYSKPMLYTKAKIVNEITEQEKADKEKEDKEKAETGFIKVKYNAFYKMV